ncbi:MAG: hypothetical protein LBU11_03950 [Zoogloeaceae bacterium]|nr:hypothetical protein [Zoogloeaceae bacterium]
MMIPQKEKTKPILHKVPAKSTGAITRQTHFFSGFLLVSLLLLQDA